MRVLISRFCYFSKVFATVNNDSLNSTSVYIHVQVTFDGSNFHRSKFLIAQIESKVPDFFLYN